jgi:DNA gyrase/topoisomerase IV subunit A
MEKILKQILDELKLTRAENAEFRKDNAEFRKDNAGFRKDISEFRKDNAGFRKELGELRKDFGNRLTSLENTVSGMKEEHGKRLENLEVAIFGMREEHGTMLSRIMESKDIQRGEIDVMQIRAAKVEGAIKRAAKQVVKDLKEAQ